MYFWAKDLSFESYHFLLCNGHWKMMTFSSPGPHTQTRNKYTKRWPQYGRPIHWWRRTCPWSNEKLWEENWKPYVRDGVIEKWGRNRKKSLETKSIAYLLHFDYVTPPHTHTHKHHQQCKKKPTNFFASLPTPPQIKRIKSWNAKQANNLSNKNKTHKMVYKM